MAKNEEPAKWNALWHDYEKSMKNWNELFELVQKTSNDVQTNTLGIWKKPVTKPRLTTEKASKEELQPPQTAGGMPELHNLIQDWQNMLISAGIEQMKAYGDMASKYYGMWNWMWWPKFK